MSDLDRTTKEHNGGLQSDFDKVAKLLSVVVENMFMSNMLEL